MYFEFVEGNLHHYEGGQLLAVVAEENLDDYRKFVPEAPAVPAPSTERDGND